MQLSIENVDQAGGCVYGYSLRLHRHDQLVVAEDADADGARPARRCSISCSALAPRRKSGRPTAGRTRASSTGLRRRSRGSARNSGAADRARLQDYLENIREIERRIQQVEARNSSGESRELPDAPIGVPDSFSEHVKIMMDLQVLAFASDVTRVFSFKLGRDGSSRSYPESGVTTGFHPASHHGEREERIIEYSKINRYHVSMVPYLLEKLKNTPDGDGNLLDNSLVIYGSPMGDSNVHNHKRCPLFLAGHMGGRLKGGRTSKAADGTPMANVMLTLLHNLGRDDVQTFGDSTAEFDLNATAAYDAMDRRRAEERRWAW